MMKRMNNWLAQIRTRSRRKHILHCTHAKIIDSQAPHCQLSRVTFHVSPVAGSCRVATGCLLDNLASSPTHPGNSSMHFFYQVLSFENDPWAGLRRILAVACATANKHWCVQKPVFVGRLSLWVNHLSHGIQTSQIQSITTVLHRLSFSAQLSNCNVVGT